MRKEKKVTELSEDIEVVGPGQMLVDARTSMGLSQQDVADKLNFRVALVKDIEEDKFDKSLPSTYNRGYLRNYAKLVNIPVDEVLSSYEMLGVAAVQGAEMQSFSKITEKQAQNNRLMWISYLILAILVGSTLVWWLQDMNIASELSTAPQTNSTAVQKTENASVSDANTSAANSTSDNIIAEKAEDSSLQITKDNNEQNGNDSPSDIIATAQVTTSGVTADNESPQLSLPANALNTQTQVSDLADVNEARSAVNQTALADSQTSGEAAVPVIFTFAGDCWVNIYDATGERIAWGVKKSGYVMTISGVAPLKITLGKPELVQINYAGQDVDMSQFNAGNIAKFNLPLES